ncbi:GGDEF domain-containing protein [Vibrio algarum]|uniref:diguanylate cyclase n=1 Tax=Vibrio algarum TaxID=3020714 RepID=A0ABT4YN06_9VIBR|nr:sensor domain-containing diguanylate cyclase [Vibrio sp. KJ40-1]MDB1122932.1 sensor domain-containing diguanylate cyclase [Vibrio sp. KJ40-1]
MFRERWLGFIALACLSLCIGVGAAHYFKYRSAYDKNVEQIIETSQFQLRFTARSFTRLKAQVSSTFKLTGNNRALKDYVQSENPIDKKRVEEVWQALANYQRFFKQIRFVDNTGQEKIKVSFSNQDQKAEISTDYHFFGEPYYLRFAHSIANNTIGNLGPMLETSSIDKEKSLTPVQYAITPFEINGVRKGYLVLTIDIWLVKSMLDYSPQPEFIPQLLTSSGDYVAHPNAEMLFGFSIRHRKIHNLALTHNDLWQDMLVNGSGITQVESGLYVYRLIDLSASKSMYALIHFSNQQLSQHVSEDYTEIVESAVLIMFLILVACVPFVHIAYDFKRKKVDSSLALAALNGMTAVIVCDSRYRVLKVNKELERMTGYVDGQIHLRKIRKLFFKSQEGFSWLSIYESVKNNGQWEGELVIRVGNGAEIITLTRVQALLDDKGNLTNYIISIVDISERKELEERLRYLSERDELSQLWNRRKFEQELRSEAELFQRYPESHVGYLALLDIDYFKRINDNQGHDEGDRVIRRVADCLVENTRKTDSVSRIGGEEFAIIMKHTKAEDAQIILERIRMAIETDPQHTVTISIGYTDIISDSSACYKYADIALFESKSLGRNKVSRCESTDDIA